MIYHQVQPSLHHHVMLLTKVWVCGFLAGKKKKKNQVFQAKQRKITVSTINSMKSQKKYMLNN